MRLSAKDFFNNYVHADDFADEDEFEEEEEFILHGAEAKLAKGIKLLALDVDGVLTDGTIYIGNEGEVFKGFNAKDGLGISCALRSGMKVVIITGRKSEIIRRRAAELGITTVLEGVQDKKAALCEVLRQNKLRLSQAAYIGDDLNDMAAMLACGLAFTPADASADAMEAADFVTPSEGGRGAVRDVVELLLKAQDKWDDIVLAYAGGGQGDRQ